MEDRVDLERGRGGAMKIGLGGDERKKKKGRRRTKKRAVVY